VEDSLKKIDFYSLLIFLLPSSVFLIEISRKMRGGDPGKGGKKTMVASDRQPPSTGLS